eukprot:1152491-Pelagomonas_calceolata.AAC.2
MCTWHAMTRQLKIRSAATTMFIQAMGCLSGLHHVNAGRAMPGTFLGYSNGRDNFCGMPPV